MTDQISTIPKPFCFVLMPFDKAFDDVYQLGIKAACDAAGAYCERVDEQIFHERILDRVYNQISKADFIVADMTGRNPNVFYEAGYAHALGRPTILLTRDAEDIPFDLKHYFHIVYEGRLVDLREQLTKRLKYFIEHPPKSIAESRNEIEVMIDGERLDSDVVTITKEHDYQQHFSFAIHNTSYRTLEAGDFSIGVISSRMHAASDAIKEVVLANDEHLVLLPEFSKLLPDAYESFHLILFAEPSFIGPDSEYLTVKIFTQQGVKEHRILLLLS